MSSDGVTVVNVKYKGDDPRDAATYENVAFRGDSNENVDKAPPPYNSKLIHETHEMIPMDDTSKTKYTLDNIDTVATPADECEEDEDEEPPNAFLRAIKRAQDGCAACCSTNKKAIKIAVIVILLLLYAAYFCYAMYYSFGDEGSVRLLWVTCLVVFGLLVKLFWRCCGESVSRKCRPCTAAMAKHENKISWILVSILFLFVIIFVLVDVFYVSRDYYNLVSAAGMLCYVLLLFVFSYSPAKVQWRAVAWGLGLQFLFAIIILRWDWGYNAFRWLGDRVTEFLAYSDAGALFVFSAPLEVHFFAFKVLPTIIFFSTAISVLYYLGVMQWIIDKVAGVMQFAMGTTAGESLNAAANIFIGQTEAPLVIKPLLPKMTRSEIHAVMTGGFATIAGGVLAAYISFNVPANHLLSASVMSAPAALAMAKLFYPETQKSQTTAKDVAKLEKSREPNLIAAASNGASMSIKLVANIAVNLIAFLAALEFINATLGWFGARVGVEYLTFQWICSYVLWPLALIMGVEVADCRTVAELIGVKTFFNEFIAYTSLGAIIGNRELFEEHVSLNGTYTLSGNMYTLEPPGAVVNATEVVVMSLRSEVISTYALCGFANVGSIGIQLGALGAMAPERKGDLARVAVRAMIAGNVACFMTACIAGLFYNQDNDRTF